MPNNCLSFLLHIIVETQTIANLLGDADNESLKFATRKWYVVNDQNKTVYGEGNENGATIELKSLIKLKSLNQISLII